MQRPRTGLPVAASLLAALCIYASAPAFSSAPKPEETLDLPSLPAPADSNASKPQLPAPDKNTIAAPATPPALPGADTGLPAVTVPAAVTPPQPAPLPPTPNNNAALQQVIAPSTAAPDAGKTSLPVMPATPVMPTVPAASPVQQPPSAAAPPALPDANKPALPAVSVTPVMPATPVSAGTQDIPAVPTASSPPETPAAPAVPDSDRTGGLTLMFSKDDMEVIAKMLRAYDSFDEHKVAATAKDKISDLFPIDDTSAPQTVQTELPNLYLGSIVYTSPKSWVITVNGRRISSSSNSPGGELYVTQISRKEIEIIWKPHSLNDVPEKWNQATEGGKKPIPGILVDAANGSIRVHMFPNQTFVPSKLAIKEGLIRPDESFFEKFREALDSLTKSSTPPTVRQP